MSELKKIKNREMLMDSLINLIPDQVVMMNLKGDIIELINETDEQGCKTGDNIRDIWSKEEVALHFEMLSKAQKIRDVVEYEYQTSRNGNKERVYCSRMKVNPEDNHVVLLLRDITERKETKKKIEQSSSIENLAKERNDELEKVITHLSTVINNSDVILFSTDKNGVFTMSQGNGLTALGLKPNQVVGESVFDFYSNSPEIQEDMRLALNGKRIKKNVKLGSLFYEVEYIPTFHNKEVSGMLGFAVDITWRVESEEKYKNLVESSSEGLFTSNIEGDFTLVNDIAANITGYSREELLKMSFKDLVRKDYVEIVDKYYAKQFLEKRELSKFSFPINTKSGEEKWIQQSLRLQFKDLKKKHIKLFQASVKDITSEMLAKEKADYIDKKLKELELVVNNSSIVARTDSKGIITYANERFCEISGYTLKELIGKNQSIVSAHHHSIDFWKDMWRSIGRGQFWRGEIKNMRKDGNYYWVDTVIAPLLNENGKPREYVSIRWDVTERKIYEEELRESEERFRELFEGTSDLIQIVEEDGTVEFVNKAWKEKLRYTEKDLESLNIWDVIHPSKKEECGALFEKTKENLFKSIIIDTDFVTKKGDTISVRGNTITTMRNGKKLTRSIFHDITEITRNLEKEKELNKLRNMFVSGASHQFRTPLTVIQSNVELLDLIMEGLSDEMMEKYNRISRRMQQEVTRMTNLMNDVLVLGKINSKAIPNIPKKMDLVDFCKNIVEQHNAIQSDGRLMEFESNKKSIKKNIDPNLLDHALANLISNAFKYSVGSSNPSFLIVKEDKNINILVNDSGMGISNQDLRGLFQPFFRADNVKDIEGTGLGLSIVKEYIELIGGTIEVTSRVNEGTTFKIIL